MDKHHAWILKNKWGSYVLYFSAPTCKGVVEKIGKARWEAWKAEGHKILKVKFVEVE